MPSADQDRKLNQERVLFTRQYTQEIVAKDVRSLFDSYYKFIDGSYKDLEDKALKKVTEGINKKSLSIISMFGSPKTVRLFALYKQFSFSIDVHQEKYSIHQMAYISILLSRLRYDYSSEWIEPIIFLKTNINDISKLSSDLDYIYNKHKNLFY